MGLEPVLELCLLSPLHQGRLTAVHGGIFYIAGYNKYNTEGGIFYIAGYNTVQYIGRGILYSRLQYSTIHREGYFI